MGFTNTRSPTSVFRRLNRRRGFVICRVGHNSWLLASDFWLLASGFWLLASGFWLLASGFWLLASGFWLLASGFCPSAFQDLTHLPEFFVPLRKQTVLRSLIKDLQVGQ